MSNLFICNLCAGTCNEYDVQLSDVYTYYTDNSTVEVTTGILEVCINGIYQQVCNSYNLDLEFANGICFSQGYGGKLVTYMIVLLPP